MLDLPSTFVHRQPIRPHRDGSPRRRRTMGSDGGMADVGTADRGTALLPGAHRMIRMLDPTEGPFSGALVTRGDEVAVRVDTTALAGWVGWRFAGAEHVAGPVDVIRRLDGHDALLPWCTDRVMGLLVRRTAAGSVLSSGECSTLVVSLLRGLDELGAGVDEVQAGVWWLTEGGRPILVIGQGDDPRAGAVEIVAHLAEHSGDKALGRVLRTVEQGLEKALSQPRVPRRSLEQWEQELLGIAAPRPLARETHAPEHARDLARAAAAADRALSQSPASRRAGRQRSSASGRRSLLAVGSAVLMSTFDAVRSRALARPATRTVRPRRSEEPKADRGVPVRRRRVLIFAGAAAAAVLIGGLLWPTGDAAESADPAREQKTSAEPSDAASAPSTEKPVERRAAVAPAPPQDDSPERAAAALVTMIDECRAAGDFICPHAVAAGSVGVVEALAATARHEPSWEMVDEYGDVAVIRAGSSADDVGQGEDAATAPADQVVVLVRQNEKWLVRDVYGVADQPE